MINESADVPLTVKSLASTVAGSTEPLKSIMKSVGGRTTIIPHVGLVTVQGVAFTAARAARNAMMATNNVVIRFTFIFHYHFVLRNYSV